MLALVLLAICSAVWFVSIQAVLLQSFCLYCLTVHGCALVLGGFTWALCRDPHALAQPDPMGLLLGGDQEFLEEDDAPQSLPLRGWLTSLAVAAAGLLVLMGGQLLFTPEVAMVMEEVEFAPPAVETPAPLANPPAEAPAQVNQPVLASPAVPAQDLPRLYAIRALSEPVDLATMPMLGRLNAEHVMVEMMDYTCEHCRLIHPHVRAALDRYGDQLSVVIHHVPLSKKCNPHVPIPKDYPGKKYACDYAQLAIGVWNLAPEEFPAFHDWLLTGEKPPSPTEARQRALRLVGEAVLLDKQVKADIKRRLAEQATVFKSLRSGLPILLFADGALRGVPEESEKLFEYLETKLGIEPR
jgi:protein-disulfide isomerase